MIISVLSVLAFISCNDDPASIPSSLPPEGDKVVFEVFDSKDQNVNQNSGFYENLENLYGGGRRLLGRNSYAKSSILFHWDVYLPDSTINYINEGVITVDTALVTMRVSYHLGFNSPVSFAVQPLQGEWSNYTLKRDSLQYITNDGDPSILASQINQTDTTVSFLLDNNEVYNWLKFKADTNLQNTNYGIILKPTAASQGFIGFNSTFYSSADTLETTLKIILKKSSEPFDSISVYPDKDLHVVESVGNVPVSSPDKIILEGGYAFRGNLFIDISSLPKDIAVNKAILELSVDSLNTVNGDPGSDSLLVYMFADSTTKALTSDSTVITKLIRKGNKFTGNITWMMQRWLTGTENQGLELSLYDEYESVAKIVLYGSKEANIDLRPRLTIYYPKRQ